APRGRGLSDRAVAGTGAPACRRRAAAPCLPGRRAGPDAEAPPCRPGLACRTIMAASDGLLRTSQCLPPDPIALSGLPCLAGRIGAAAAPFRDRVTAIRPLALSPSAAGRPPNRC